MSQGFGAQAYLEVAPTPASVAVRLLCGQGQPAVLPLLGARRQLEMQGAAQAGLQIEVARKGSVVGAQGDTADHQLQTC